MIRGSIALAAVFILAFASAAQADTFSVFADVPVAGEMKSTPAVGKAIGTETSPSGFKVGLTLPFYVGLAYESYSQGIDPTTIGGATGYSFNTTMTDVFLNLPLPVVNIAVGMGAGTSTIKGPQAVVGISDAALTQTFVSLGLPFAAVFDVHLGYHMISGKQPVKGSADYNVSGSMTSLGVKFGF